MTDINPIPQLEWGFYISSLKLENRIFKAYLLSFIIHAAVIASLYRVPMDSIANKNVEAAGLQVEVLNHQKSMNDLPQQIKAEAAAVVTEPLPEQVGIRAESAGGSFIRSKELDVGPRPVERIVVPAPSTASSQKGGYLILELYIDEHGKVVRTHLLDGAVPDEWVSLAIQTFKQARYHPGMRAGQPYPSIMKVKVEFVD